MCTPYTVIGITPCILFRVLGMKDSGPILFNAPVTVMYNSTNYKSYEQTVNWVRYTLT